MRGAAGRSGVASVVTYGDRERLAREHANKVADEAIWKVPPRTLLSPAELAERTKRPASEFSHEGEVCFRIRRPTGYSIGYDIQPKVVAITGETVKESKFRTIDFREEPGGQYGEFITADPVQIARLERPDAVRMGVVRWDALAAVRNTEEGAAMAEKLKDANFVKGFFQGARALGLDLADTFAAVLAPKPSEKSEDDEDQEPA